MWDNSVIKLDAASLILLSPKTLLLKRTPVQSRICFSQKTPLEMNENFLQMQQESGLLKNKIETVALERYEAANVQINNPLYC